MKRGAVCNAIKDVAFHHRIDEGHRGEKKQQQFGIFQQVMAQEFGDGMGLMLRGIRNGRQDPDRTCRHHDGFRFPQIKIFFDNHQHIRGQKHR